MRKAQHRGRRICDGGGGLRNGRHERPLHAKAEVQRRRVLNMTDEEGGTTGDGAGGLHSRKKQTNLFQRRGERGTDAHRPSDGPGGASRGRIAEKRRLPTTEAILAD